MNYWIMLNGEQIGPMSLNELLEQPLKPDTPVWHEGMPDWRAAIALPQISQKLWPSPPTYLTWSVISMLLCCLPTGIVALVYSCLVTSRHATGNLEGARRASERASIWIMVTIALGLIAIPFQIITMFL